MLAQKLILGYGSKILVQFFRVVASILVARIAGPSVLGTIAYGIAFVSMFEFLADLGIGSAHIKLISEGENLGSCISTYSILKIINTVFFFFVVLGIFLTQKYVLHKPFESSTHEHVIIIMLITITVNQFLYIPRDTFAGKTEQAKQDIPLILRMIFYQILRVAIVLLGYRAIALALGNLASVLIIIPLILYLFKDYPRKRFNRRLASRYFKISIPIIMIGMSTKIIRYMDKVVLQYYTNSEQVGYYAAGYRIGGFILLIASQIGILFFPLFSKAASEGNLGYIKKKIEKFERISFIFIMPTVIFVVIYADVIVKVLLGNQYLPSIPILALLTIATFIVVLNMPYGNVLTGMGFFKLMAIINMFNLFFFSALIFTLPNPKAFNLGAKGAAIAVLVSHLFLGVLYRVFAKQKSPNLNMSKATKFVIFGLLNFASFYVLYQYLTSLFGFYFKIAFIPVYFVSTYLFLFLFGLMGKKDLNTFKELINFKKLGDYVKDELRGL